MTHGAFHDDQLSQSDNGMCALGFSLRLPTMGWPSGPRIRPPLRNDDMIDLLRRERRAWHAFVDPPLPVFAGSNQRIPTPLLLARPSPHSAGTLAAPCSKADSDLR